MPGALRVRADDRHDLKNLRRVDHDEDGRPFFLPEYGAKAADEIHRWKEGGICFWSKPESELPAWARKARGRAEEILATFNAWEDERDDAHRASGIDEAEAAVGAAMRAQRDVRQDAMRAPASAEAIALKLRIFADCWKADQDGDETAGIDDFEDTESPAVEQAVAIASTS
jgi:hypothetical protein